MTSKPHRLSSCNRHPSKPVTGFCASCLRERLAGIESSKCHEYPAENFHSTAELRRTKSCSGSGAASVGSFPTIVSEPRRKSCEAGARNTLWNLFNLDDRRKGVNRKFDFELGKLGFELTEEALENSNLEIRVSEDNFVSNARVVDGRDEIVEEKTMKEFIDLEWQSRKNAGRDLKDIAGSFLEAASIFSKKLREWRHKQKLKKRGSGCRTVSNGGDSFMGLEREKPSIRRLRETQSEVGEYGLGRRSCDTDPRFSIDASRMSVDNSRFSFDEPRASWDSYLIGKTYPRLTPMISVVEDVNVQGLENRVLDEEKVDLRNEGDLSPGGSAQTKDYYMDSLSWQRRRKSIDRSNSYKKPAIPEVDELKLISNAKVSPTTTELFYGAKLLVTEKDLRDTDINSGKDMQSDCVLECPSLVGANIAGGINQKGSKKFQKWRKVWSLFGLTQRRRESKFGEEEGCVGGNVVNKPLEESWKKLNCLANGEANGSVSQKLIRSYSVSCRNTCKMAGLLGNMSGAETNGNGLKRRQEFMLQRNRSARN
ncbi:hypothetical protein O6P43_013990 [Quillaja saponaria]|uniref:Uncharacterized protein n=1 Tax=Quillaja saponaria TaxID=32244 RepID=A0AAD7LVD1_QUISA|nr:hypothetical protein O6P43_013990 [Quillaja saponaria]